MVQVEKVPDPGIYSCFILYFIVLYRMEKMKKHILCTFLFFLIGLIFICDSVSVSAKSEYELDRYGIPIRNNKDNLPSWYPDEGEIFEPFHDETIPRIVDMADIFSESEEEQMKSRIAEITSNIGKDIVVVTANSYYKLGFELYCYDFYDYNGYGIGDDYEGFCLFICMDPTNRGGWTGVTGGKSRALYTENIANEIDDVLYDYLGNKEYGKGVSNWIENINSLCTKGMPFSPEWYPSIEEKEKYIRKPNENPDRVIDTGIESGIFSQSERNDLNNRIQKISELYDTDIVIHTIKNDYHMGLQQYADDFYYYNGYGSGEDYNGIVLVIFCYNNINIYNARFNISSYGKSNEILTDVNYGRMLDHVLSSESYYECADRFMTDVEHLLKTGRVSRTFGQWMFCAVVSVIVGLFFGKRFLNRAKKKMVTVRTEYGADNYIVSIFGFDKNPLQGKDILISTDVKRTKIVRSYSSGSSHRSSSSSSHRSTYHSSSRGSSGRSHSGSGRRF